MQRQRMIAIVFIFLLTCVSLKADPLPQFKRFDISSQDNIMDSYFRDINNDGLKDLFLVTGDPAKKEIRQLNIYLQSKGGFSNQADSKVQFPADAVVYDVGPLSGNGGGPAIVFLAAKGLFFYECQQGVYNQTLKKLSDVSSIYVVPPKNAPIRAKLFFFIGQAKVPILCIPGHNQLFIIDPSRSPSYECPLALPLPVMTSLGSGEENNGEDYDPVTLSQRLVIRVPKLHFLCFDGDTKEDLIAVVKDRITVFKGLGDGLFQKEPVLSTNLDLSSGDESGFIKPNFRVHIADANGDGQQDVLVTNASMKTQNSSTKVYLFINKNGLLPDSPNQVILFANTMGNNFDFQDLNGDGCVDLVIPGANMSLFQFLKILISQKLDYTKNIHLWQNGQYSKKPDIQLEAQARFNLENPEDLQGAFFYMEGDVNGDHVPDLLKSDSDSGKITIRLGQSGSAKLFDSQVSESLEEKRLPSEIDLLDVNGDFCDDIVYRYGVKFPKQMVIWITVK